MKLTKAQLKQHLLSRVETREIGGMEISFLRFNGTQRDAYMCSAIEMRDKIPEKGEGDLTATATRISSEQAKAFTHLEYILVSMSVLDPEQLPNLIPLFKGPAEVAEQLDHLSIKAIATAAREINSLGDKEEEKIKTDFPKASSAASGSGSPDAAEPSTFTG